MSVKLKKTADDRDRKSLDEHNARPGLRMVRKNGEIYYIQESGEIIKVPGPGPANPLVRSGNLVPFPREEVSR